MPLPRIFPIRQSFPRPSVDDITARAEAELERVLPADRISDGAKIGVTVGSRASPILPGLPGRWWAI